MNLYKLAYRIDYVPEGLTASQLQKNDLGGADAIFLASIIYPEDGSLDVLFLSKDGETGKELSDDEIFKIWALLANRLTKSTTLTSGKKLLCHEVHNAIFNALSLNIKQ